MASELTIDEAVARATALQDARIGTIRDLAATRQKLSDTTAEADRRRAELERELDELIGVATREDAHAYIAATKAGWTNEELKKIGFDETTRARRVRRKRATIGAANGRANSAAPTPPATDTRH